MARQMVKELRCKEGTVLMTDADENVTKYVNLQPRGGLTHSSDKFS